MTNTNTNTAVAAQENTAAVQNVWMNNVHKAMVHENSTAAGKKFMNISFDCAASATGLASISVNPGQVRTATDKTGVEKPDWKNVLLGKPGTTRQVSIKKADGTYERITMSVEQIKTCFEEGRKAYREAHKTVAADAAAATTEQKPARRRAAAAQA